MHVDECMWVICDYYGHQNNGRVFTQAIYSHMHIPLNVILGIVLYITASSLLREVNRSDQSTVVHVQESVNTELQH